MYNLLSYLWEIETGLVYKMTKDHDVYSGLGSEATGLKLKLPDVEDTNSTENGKQLSVIDEVEEEVEIEENSGIIEIEEEGNEKEVENLNKKEVNVTDNNNDLKQELNKSIVLDVKENLQADDDVRVDENELIKEILRAENITESLNGIKVIPLLGTPSEILDKSKFDDFFDATFVSARATQCIETNYFKTMMKTKNGIIAIETAKFLIPLTKKVQIEYNKKIEEYASKQEWIEVKPSPVPRRRRDENDNEDDVIFFRN